MGCIQASAYTGDPNAILGTYTGVNALDQCNNYCGVCCVPGCESDFANVTACTATPETIPDFTCYYCEAYYDEFGNPYVNTNNKISCLNGEVPYPTGSWTTIQNQWGYCPANHVGGCFEGRYDCASELLKSSGEIIQYDVIGAEDPTNPDSFLSGGNPGSATSSDPCGGSYPCTKIRQSKTFSTILIHKNPYGQYNACAPTRFSAKNEFASNGMTIWDSSYLGILFFDECVIGCPNGTGTIDYGIQSDITGPGSYANYIPDCCSGVINPNNGTNKDKVFVFRIKGSLQKVIKYNEGTHLSNQSSLGLEVDSLCNSCVETPGEASGVYIDEIHYAINRSHDLTVYLCDTNAGTMNDISSYICNKNIPFFVPTLWDSIDWVGNEGYQYNTVNNFSAIVGTMWGFFPIGQSNGTQQLTYPGYCQQRSPCNIDGFTRNNQNPNDVCPPCDPFNGIVGNMRQSDGTLYVVHTATAVSGSLTPIGIASVISTQFQDMPNIAGNVNVNYVCNDTIGQSGCADQLSSIWHSGQDCTSFDCNA